MEAGREPGLELLGMGPRAREVALKYWTEKSKAGVEDVKFFLDEGDRPEDLALRKRWGGRRWREEGRGRRSGISL